MQEERRTSQSETNLGEGWKVDIYPFAFGSELALCQCCGGRIAEKDGDDRNDAAGSSGYRKQMGGGDSTKVEAAKRRRQD